MTGFNLEVNMKLLRVRGAEWKILAVCTERGDCPLLDFLATLEGRLARDGRRMLRLLERVAVAGPPRNTEVSHQVEAGVWEFVQGRIRVMWFYDEGKLIVCSHGFVKRSRRAPVWEIRRAREARWRYTRDKMAGLIEVAE